MTAPVRVTACPTCRKVASVVEPKVAPFCSARCQQIDLGRWLSEEYRIPEPMADESGGGVEGLPAAGEGPGPRGHDG